MSEETETRWRTIQFFLLPTGSGVCEVESDVDGHFKCSCRTYDSRGACRHIRFVQNRSKSNNGVYPLKVSKRASSKEIATAQRDPKQFREFVIKYGKVEVL